jgi:rubrerythrin
MKKNTVTVQEVQSTLPTRRSFLKMSGLALAGTGLLIAGCSDDDDGGGTDTTQLPGVRNGVFDLGGGDLGVLTYAYALEQLEADFYTRVVNGSNFGSTFSADEKAVLEDLYRHEVIHREFFRTALGGALNDSKRLLPDLTFDYGSLNFSSRDQVLNTAKTLEDTGVAAYNGAGRYISDANYLLIAGKIVSVEARHASAIRSLLNPGSEDFAGDDVVIPTNGLGQAKKPSEIITAVSSLKIIQTKFTAQYLP